MKYNHSDKGRRVPGWVCWADAEGRIWSPKRQRPMTGSVNSIGYVKVRVLREDGVNKICGAHRLVALAWHENPAGLTDVDHIDLNKLNNHPSNLRWLSHRDNLAHARAGKEWRYTGKGRRVIAYVTGLWECEFKSIKEACDLYEKKYQTFAPVILRAIKHEWRAYGCRWRYAS